MTSLADAHSSHLLKTICAKIQVEDVTSTAEAILLSREDSTSEEVLVLPLHIQRELRVYHVLKLVATSHLAAFRHLTDDDGIDHVGLAVIRNHLQASLCSSGRDTTGLELAVLHALEGIYDQDEVLTGIRSANLVAVFQQLRDVRLLPSDETATKVETLSGHSNLIQALRLC